MSDSYGVAVLASGSGSNFQSLLDRFHGRDELVRFALLLASRPGIVALERAERAGVPTAVIPEELRVPVREADEDAEGRFLLDTLSEAATDLVVLAGYLRLVPASVVRHYWGRIINIHPALLPSFGGEGLYGKHVHRAVLESRARVSGVTVHFVDEEYDRGPIIAQWPVPVMETDDPDALAARVLDVEHRLLPAVVGALSRGHVELTRDRNVRWLRPWFSGSHFTIDGLGPGA